jgi:hypothetical protein
MKTTHVILSVCVLVTALACNEGPVTPLAIAGTYALATVNGESLPAIVTIAGDTTVVVGDTMVLTAERTYTRHSVDTLRMDETAPILSSYKSRGTFTTNGDSITFTDGNDNVSVTGTIVGGLLTVTTKGFGYQEGDDPAELTVTTVFNKR